jgi:hypothetical protein
MTDDEKKKMENSTDKDAAALAFEHFNRSTDGASFIL